MRICDNCGEPIDMVEGNYMVYKNEEGKREYVCEACEGTLCFQDLLDNLREDE